MSDEQKIPEALRELYGEACAKVKGHRMYPHPWGQVCDLIERIARSEQALAALDLLLQGHSPRCPTDPFDTINELRETVRKCSAAIAEAKSQKENGNG